MHKNLPEDLDYAFPLYSTSTLPKNHRPSSGCKGRKAYNLQFILYYSAMQLMKDLSKEKNCHHREKMGKY